MKDRRRQFFFWLGVFVLPLFWSWFTLAKGFTWRERLVAFLWLGVFVAWLLQQRSALVERFEMVSFVYPAILGWVTVALFVWLFFRIAHFFSVTFLVIVFILAVVFFGGIHRSTFFVDRLETPFQRGWLLLPGLAVLAHLALEPLGLCRLSKGKSLVHRPLED